MNEIAEKHGVFVISSERSKENLMFASILTDLSIGFILFCIGAAAILKWLGENYKK